MPPQIYITVWEDLHNISKMYLHNISKTKKGGVTFILAVVLLPSPPCRGDAVRFQIWYKYGVTFPSHAWGIRPITMHW